MQRLIISVSNKHPHTAKARLSEVCRTSIPIPSVVFSLLPGAVSSFITPFFGYSLTDLFFFLSLAPHSSLLLSRPPPPISSFAPPSLLSPAEMISSTASLSDTESFLCLSLVPVDSHFSRKCLHLLHPLSVSSRQHSIFRRYVPHYTTISDLVRCYFTFSFLFSLF
jgi:hypothetical protein